MKLQAYLNRWHRSLYPFSRANSAVCAAHASNDQTSAPEAAFTVPRLPSISILVPKGSERR